MLYQKTLDLLDLAIWMQSTTDGVSLQDIKDKYKVSQRTAIRMKDMIKSKFPQIQETTGRYNHKLWFIPQNNNNQYIGFCLNDINALQNAIKLMKTKKMNDAEDLQNLMNKIKVCMGKGALNRIEPDAEILMEAEGYVLRPGPKMNINKEYMDKLRNAVLACKVVRIKYDSSHDQDWRTIHPYGFLYGNKHYLIAWQNTLKAMCHFDLNKIKALEVKDKYFNRDPNFSLQTFSEQAFGVYQEEPFDVEWLFDAEVANAASQYIFHPRQTMQKNEDGTLTVKFRAGGAREMDWHLYTWGNHVKVIQPKDFKERCHYNIEK